MNDNTKLFIDTIDGFARCQGSYSRMSQAIHLAIEDDPSTIDKLNETLPKFNDSLDVVMYIEG